MHIVFIRRYSAVPTRPSELDQLARIAHPLAVIHQSLCVSWRAPFQHTENNIRPAWYGTERIAVRLVYDGIRAKVLERLTLRQADAASQKRAMEHWLIGIDPRCTILQNAQPVGRRDDLIGHMSHQLIAGVNVGPLGIEVVKSLAFAHHIPAIDISSDESNTELPAVCAGLNAMCRSLTTP